MSMDTTGRRPIEAHEVQPLLELGELISYARSEAGLTQAELARRVQVGLRHMQKLEAGHRRTRRSTLARIAEHTAAAMWFEPDELLEEFVEAAGVALAPESQFADNVERRRVGRAKRRHLAAWLAEYERAKQRREARAARRAQAA